MNWYQILNAIAGYCILLAGLVLAWLAYRSTVRRTVHIITLERLLTETIQANVESARSAAESARIAVETVHNLIALEAKKDEHTSPKSE